MTTMYTGDLSVEPGAFSARVERIILKRKRIHFDFRYYYDDEPSEYNLHGIAILRPEGHYESSAISYPDESGEATIYILKVRPGEEECYIEGFWFETKPERGESGAWRISGTLETLEQPDDF